MLPKILYVYKEIENEHSDDDYWYMTSESKEELASSQESRLIGVYELKEIQEVILEVSMKTTIKSKNEE